MAEQRGGESGGSDSDIYSEEERGGEGGSGSSDEGSMSSLSLQETFAAAKEHQADGNEEDAIMCYGYALQLAEARYGLAAAESAAYYFHYGDILLTSEDRSAEDLLDKGAEEEVDAGTAQPQAGTAAAGANSPGGRERPQDDVELAWEMLELARVCLLKQPEARARQKLLADTHTRLGDLHQANEQFETAAGEYGAAVALRRGLEHRTAAETRALAAECCNLARAMQWSNPPRLPEAVEQYGVALATVDSMLHTAAAADLPALRADITAKLVELGGTPPAAPAAAAAAGTKGKRKLVADTTEGGPAAQRTRGRARPQAVVPIGELVLENEAVRVWRRRLQPGEATGHAEYAHPWLSVGLAPCAGAAGGAAEHSDWGAGGAAPWARRAVEVEVALVRIVALYYHSFT